MNQEQEAAQVSSTEPTGSEYAAPRIETVVTADDLEREVHYAGVQDAISILRP